jgi:hypothetical protein
MALRVLALILFCAASGNLVGGCLAFAAQDAPVKSSEQKRTADENDITEAVFRYQFIHNDSFIRRTAAFYYLSLGGAFDNNSKDVSDEFLKRFDGNTPPVRKFSKAHYDLVEGITDKETGKKGLAFEVRTIKWLGDDAVEVEGGYIENGTSASGELFTVKREGGMWVVKSSKGLWIS